MSDYFDYREAACPALEDMWNRNYKLEPTIRIRERARYNGDTCGGSHVDVFLKARHNRDCAGRIIKLIVPDLAWWNGGYESTGDIIAGQLLYALRGRFAEPGPTIYEYQCAYYAAEKIIEAVGAEREDG